MSKLKTIHPIFTLYGEDCPGAVFNFHDAVYTFPGKLFNFPWTLFNFTGDLFNFPGGHEFLGILNTFSGYGN